MRALWIVAGLLLALLAGVAWFVLGEQHGEAAAEHAAAGAAPGTRPNPTELDRAGDDEAARDELAMGEEALALELAAARANRPPTRLVGRVVDHAGTPIAGARVLCALSDSGPSEPLDSLDWRKRRRGLREELSDDEGRFAFEGLEAGLTRVALRGPDHAPRDLDDVLVADGRDTDLGDVALELGVRISGRVLDERGAPVEGAWLLWPYDTSRPSVGREPGDNGLLLAQSEPDGSFDLRGLPTGPWSLMAWSPQHPEVVMRGSTSAPGEHVAGLLLRFPRAASISGFVVAPDGPLAPPLGELRILAYPIDESSTVRGDVHASRRASEVAADGAFAVEGLEPERFYRLRAVLRETEARRREQWLDVSVEAQGGASGVEIRLAGLIAVVFDPRDASSGERLDAVSAQLHARGRDGVARSLQSVVSKQSDGRYRLHSDRGLEPDELAYLAITSPTHHALESESFVPRRGEEFDLGELRMRPRQRLTFLVLAPNGEPAAGARVMFEAAAAQPTPNDGRTRGPGSTMRSDPSDADGIARLYSDTGACGSAIARHGELASSAPVAVCFGASETPVELRLTKGAELLVRVSDAFGSPASSRSVQVTRDSRTPLQGVEAMRYFERTQIADWNGEARFEGLTPGAYRVALIEPRIGAPRSEDEHAAAMAWLELAADEVAQAQLVALRRGRLTGRVLSGRRPLANALVTLSPPSSQHPRVPSGRHSPVRSRTDADGRYRIEDLGPGKWNVTVSHADFVVPTRTTLDYEGDERTFDISLTREAVVGRAVDARGDALAGVKVIVGRWRDVSNSRDRRAEPFTPFYGGAPAAVTGDDGAFELTGLPAERLAIELRHPERQTLQTAPFVPGSDATTDLGDLVLQRGGSIRVELTVLPGDGPRPRAIARRLDGPRPANGSREVRVETLDSRGVARFDSLAPGKWRVELDSRVRDQPRPRQEVEVQAGKAVEARFATL